MAVQRFRTLLGDAEDGGEGNSTGELHARQLEDRKL